MTLTCKIKTNGQGHQMATWLEIKIAYLLKKKKIEIKIAWWTRKAKKDMGSVSLDLIAYINTGKKKGGCENKENVKKRFAYSCIKTI